MSAPASTSTTSSSIPATPSQCSLWFDPRQWSARYSPQFFTASFIDHQVQQQIASYTLEVKAAKNVWKMQKTEAECEEFRKEVTAELHTLHDTATVIPALPAKKFLASLLGQEDVSEEYLKQRTILFNTWLHAVLGASRTIAHLAAVRKFLDLDHAIPKEEEENGAADDDEEGQQQDEAKQQAQ